MTDKNPQKIYKKCTTNLLEFYKRSTRILQEFYKKNLLEPHRAID